MSYHLYEHQNRHAPVRSNGKRFWGYPERSKPVRLIVIHTAENAPDYVGEDGGAEAVARYQASVERPSSYHELVDSDSFVPMLPDVAVAFGARGANADGIHLSVATQARLWHTKPKSWRDATVARLATRAKVRAERHHIPVRQLTRAQIADGHTKGFASHADTEAVFGTPGRRSDPGANFPWTDFFSLIKSEEDDMTDDDRELLRGVADSLARIEKQLGGRKVGDDLFRLRMDSRALGRRHDMEVDVNGDPGQAIVS